MKKLRYLYLFCLCTALAVLVSLSGGPLYPLPAAHAGTVTKGFDSTFAFGARPLWQYATKIGGGQIPPCLSSSTPPRCYSPRQVRDAYNIQPLLNAGITGKGHTIVLIDGSTSPTLRSDVHLYDQLYGLKDPQINVIAPFGVPPFDPGAYVETALDVEEAHSLAPGATIDLVLANTSSAQTPGDFVTTLLKATKYAVDNNLGDVISQSFGVGETCVSSAYLQAEHDVFSEARAENITVLASAGDSGAGETVCHGSTITFGKTVAVPAADPLATAVGGTTLDATLHAGNYVSETTWNEWNQGGGATGGGLSAIFSRPDYQNGIASHVGAHRGVPDVAFDADPFTGVPVVVSVSGGTLIVPVGGTSVGSPAWAAIVALANQAAGRRIGFLNTAVYQIIQSGSYLSGFHDITTGNNTVNTVDQKGNTVTIPGYHAHSGWDAVTGAGTPKAGSLVYLLARYS
jgi:subtilase family serine protease